MNFIRIAAAILLLASSASVAMSHGGGTDKNGCHNDNKNGGRHCH
ncbi:YHYH domain-containing protein [Neorhizobium galegae]|nr:YHYH domain-containing protein [Neorhizobium galegae]MCQ1855880.1 YHYH domain-containing protein [Neorhizobium galegae]